MDLRSIGMQAGLVAIAALTTCCSHPLPGSRHAALRVGDVERTYLVHLPPGHGPHRRWPLVVALHGRGGSGVQMEAFSGFSALADREGVVVAYPDGIRRSWNDLRGESPAAHAGADDVRFVGALIDAMVAQHGVEPRQVFVAGASNGGMMTFRLACALSGKITAAAAVIALMPRNAVEACRPARPVPMMIVAGTEDGLVPFAGGDIHGEVLSAHDTRERWATLNGCEPAGPPALLDAVDDGTRVHRTVHPRCRDGAEVVLDAVEGGGHTWPGGPQYLPRFVVGRVSREIDGAEELWRFFARHRGAPAGEARPGPASPRAAP